MLQHRRFAFLRLRQRNSAGSVLFVISVIECHIKLLEVFLCVRHKRNYRTCGTQCCSRVLEGQPKHIEMVSEDVFQTDHSYVAVMLYQQYFMRAKNRAALMVLISGTIGQSSTRVKTVATASSEGLIFDFDWGAAADFASEPIDLLTRKFETRES